MCVLDEAGVWQRVDRLSDANSGVEQTTDTICSE